MYFTGAFKPRVESVVAKYTYSRREKKNYDTAELLTHGGGHKRRWTHTEGEHTRRRTQRKGTHMKGDTHEGDTYEGDTLGEKHTQRGNIHGGEHAQRATWRNTS